MFQEPDLQREASTSVLKLLFFSFLNLRISERLRTLLWNAGINPDMYAPPTSTSRASPSASIDAIQRLSVFTASQMPTSMNDPREFWRGMQVSF
jgi:hypothetical protein